MLIKSVKFIIARRPAKKYYYCARNFSNSGSSLQQQQQQNPTAKWKEPNGYDTGIQIYNCVAKRKVPLILRNKSLATCYSCGPTVYDSAHIGHAVCYLKFDIIQRILREYFDIKLVTVMGVTDVDDKIIKRASERGELHNVLAKRYETEFMSDMRRFDITPAHMTARVTDYMPQIVEFIQKLIDDGHAYSTGDGSVYFDTNKYGNYGKLQNFGSDTTEEDKTKVTTGKQSAQDFALWKAAKQDEPFWNAKWGKGRPGWHIECSVMASYLLGRNIDLHIGGIDLRFPHHENEEAQSCAYHRQEQWVNYWLHIGHLKIKQSGKMSKSLKNSISVVQFLDKYPAEVLRVACLLSHYRGHMLYSDEFMAHSMSIYNKINTFLGDCTSYTRGQKQRVDIDEAFVLYQVDQMNKSIEQSLKDDFDTAKSMSAILKLVDHVNKILNSGRPDNNRYLIAQNHSIVAMVQSSVKDRLKSFGLDMERHKLSNVNDTELDKILNGVVQVRDDIRRKAIGENQKAMFEVCDRIRDVLKELGVEIKDHGKASSWSFVSRRNDLKKT